MGLLKGVFKVFDIICQEAEKERLDEKPYMDALDELFLKLNCGEISEEEYDKEEETILDVLMEIRKYKKEHGIEGESK